MAEAYYLKYKISEMFDVLIMFVTYVWKVPY